MHVLKQRDMRLAPVGIRISTLWAPSRESLMVLWRIRSFVVSGKALRLMWFASCCCHGNSRGKGHPQPNMGQPRMASRIPPCFTRNLISEALLQHATDTFTVPIDKAFPSVELGAAVLFKVS